MNKKYSFITIIIAMLTLLLTGCTATTSDNGTKENAIRVGLLAVEDSLPFYVARQEGLFDKHNVKVELIDFSSARDQSTAVMGGDIDVVMNDPVVTALSKKGGKDMRIIANALGASPKEGRILIIAAPNSGITEPKQLEGKNLAISNNTYMDFLSEQYMKYYGVNYDSIKLVNMPDLMLRATTVLEGKDLDAAILPDPLAAYGVMNGANIVVDDTSLESNFSRSVVAATTDCIDTKGDSLKKMMTAYKEAMMLINENPDKYKELTIECAKVPAELRESYQVPTFSPGSIVDEEYIALINEWMVNRGLLDEPYPFDEMVALEYVK